MACAIPAHSMFLRSRWLTLTDRSGRLKGVKQLPPWVPDTAEYMNCKEMKKGLLKNREGSLFASYSACWHWARMCHQICKTFASAVVTCISLSTKNCYLLSHTTNGTTVLTLVLHAHETVVYMITVLQTPFVDALVAPQTHGTLPQPQAGIISTTLHCQPAYRRHA